MARRLVDEQRERLATTSDEARARLDRLRQSSTVVEVGYRFYERDRDAYGTVLGSAIALRIFTFMVPALVALVGLLNILQLDRLVNWAVEQGASGDVARSIEQATQTSTANGIALFLSGVLLTMWAGHSLTSVLSASSAAGWNLPATESKASLKVMGSLSGLLVTVLFLVIFIGRVGHSGGVMLQGLSFLTTGAVFAVGWFIVEYSLPSATTDPGAHLPGAVVIGLAFAVVQWFMQAYLPDKLARKTELMGEIAVSVVALAYLFIIGRMMAISFSVNAVLFERFGSISDFVFALPFIRRIPRRYPKIAQFFDLEVPDPPPDPASDPDPAP